jgi:hypothetical protein
VITVTFRDSKKVQLAANLLLENNTQPGNVEKPSELLSPADSSLRNQVRTNFENALCKAPFLGKIPAPSDPFFQTQVQQEDMSSNAMEVLSSGIFLGQGDRFRSNFDNWQVGARPIAADCDCICL